MTLGSLLVGSASLPMLEKLTGIIKDIDASILIFLNGFAHHSWYLDKLVIFVDGNNIIKSGLMVSGLWWLWFGCPDDEKQRHIREQILLTIIVAFSALFFARFLACVLPFRTRPLMDPALKLLRAFDLEKHSYWSWSAFPSDHAVLFFSFAMSIRYISKKLGWILFGYSFIIICLPRIYLGVHYPTDIVLGFVIGVCMAWLANTGRIRKFLGDHVIVPWMNWLDKSPGSFYAFLFLLTYQIADIFDQIRSIGGLVFSTARHMLGK